jgi:hypothetical protein
VCFDKCTSLCPVSVAILKSSPCIVVCIHC